MELWESPDLSPLRKRRDLSTYIMEVFVWGSHHYGQLGLGENADEEKFLPTLLTSFQQKEIEDIACGDRHTLVLLKDGSIFSSGANERGQLGQNSERTKQFAQIVALEAHFITQVSSGQAHNLAVNKLGQIYAWGDNTYGQLGSSNMSEPQSKIPRLLKALSNEMVLQVACGSGHCLALTREGKLLSWGSNNHGQLGLGTEQGAAKDTPERIQSLTGLPVRQISAGSEHSAALSISGAVYTWGRNDYGQLGIGCTDDRFFPSQVKTLRSQRVKMIAAGEFHTAVLTQAGGVLTFGGGKYGQLGHSTPNDESLPRQVTELMGSTVSQIACGRRHSLALIPSSGRVFACGLGANGQLGTGSSHKCLVPTQVKANFVSAVASVVQIPRSSVDLYVVKRLYAGGDHCIITASLPKVMLQPDDFRGDHFLPTIPFLTADMLSDMSVLSPSKEILNLAELVFSSPECLNASFLDPDHYNCSAKHIGVNLSESETLLGRLTQVPSLILDMLTVCLEKRLLPSLPASPPDMEALRLFLTLPFYPAFQKPAEYRTIMIPYGRALLRLHNAPSTVIDRWWESISVKHFEYLVQIYKAVAKYLISLPFTESTIEADIRSKGLHICMEVLQKLNKVNMSNSLQKPIIPYETFYLPEVREKVNIKEDYVNWSQRSRGTRVAGQVVSFCDYPFIFDGQAKTMLLHTDAILQMQFAVEEVTRRNMLGMFLPMVDPVNPCLVLIVSRDNLVTDTINQLTKKGSADYKKPLKVIFVGEEAVDEGGVRKEFFMLLLREILDPKFGMFKYYEESRSLWFNEQTFEDPEYFHLIGILCGLAIYNQTIISLSFPLALYKKLLKRKVLLEDLKNLEPTVGRSLEQLLEYSADDIEDSFALTFQITRDVFGDPVPVELIKNGASIKVNHSNKKEFVDRYIDLVFNKSVHAPFEAFYNGFHKVVGGKVLDLFHPQELMAMVVGNENYDWEELEKTTEYKNGFTKDDVTIKLFWQVFSEMTLEDKKMFLLFLTGSDRIPIHGMKAVKMYIQAMGDKTDMLPVAHTCFNVLDLPKYTNKDMLRNKLLTAIRYSQGFGLA